MDLTTRVNLVRSLRSKTDKPEMPVRVAADLCSINRNSIYYEAKPISDTELECQAMIDYLHTNNPTWGVRQMSARLKRRGYHIGCKKARKRMIEITIDPIYPKANLSKYMQRTSVVLYLLRNADITRPNQAWSIDITYILLKHSFLYLTAIIDWYSRLLLAGIWMIHWTPPPVSKHVKSFPGGQAGDPEFRSRLPVHQSGLQRFPKN